MSSRIRSSSRPAGGDGANGGAGVNVRVIVRCRPVSEAEKRDQSHFVVLKTEAREVHVAHTAVLSGRKTGPHSSENNSTGAPVMPASYLTKIFTFDGVCNQYTAQADLFAQYVVPIVDEVLLGFNCTIFAYGQTGTGKTYTMEGDFGSLGQGTPPASSSFKRFIPPLPPLHRRSVPFQEMLDSASDSATNVLNTTLQLSNDAGIIPRAVHYVFERLEAQHTEYSVRVSYLEIYNEELNDLLNDGEKQPLRIFEDAAGKKGQSVDRLEEIPVNNPQDILNILSTAVKRRRTAETLLNRQSSRSHSIFTVMIHMKEANIDGEDIIKIDGKKPSTFLVRHDTLNVCCPKNSPSGKLNLVDLAGSENIQRSGANSVKDRAKEAGMINQSLLTLGRVINALVERSSYVPYRDSKLTRLLQESLGGRTKTCIVATVSPSSLCLEETLSTLDYAFRAKNIRNRPEVNQRLTKRIMIRELTQEIERLKLELLANREKHGVYLPYDTYAELETRLSGQSTELQDATSEIKRLNSDLAAALNDKVQLATEIECHLASFKRERARASKAEIKARRRARRVKALNQTLRVTHGNLKILRENERVLQQRCAALLDEITQKSTWEQQAIATADSACTKASEIALQVACVSSTMTRTAAIVAAETNCWLKKLIDEQLGQIVATAAETITAVKCASAGGKTLETLFAGFIEKLNSAGNESRRRLCQALGEGLSHVKEVVTAVASASQKLVTDNVDSLKVAVTASQELIRDTQKAVADNLEQLDVTRNNEKRIVSAAVEEIRALVREARTVWGKRLATHQDELSSFQEALDASMSAQKSTIDQLTGSIEQTVTECLKEAREKIHLLTESTASRLKTALAEQKKAIAATDDAIGEVTSKELSDRLSNVTSTGEKVLERWVTTQSSIGRRVISNVTRVQSTHEKCIEASIQYLENDRDSWRRVADADLPSALHLLQEAIEHTSAENCESIETIISSEHAKAQDILKDILQQKCTNAEAKQNIIIKLGQEEMPHGAQLFRRKLCELSTKLIERSETSRDCEAQLRRSAIAQLATPNPVSENLLLLPDLATLSCGNGESNHHNALEGPPYMGTSSDDSSLEGVAKSTRNSDGIPSTRSGFGTQLSPIITQDGEPGDENKENAGDCRATSSVESYSQQPTFLRSSELEDSVSRLGSTENNPCTSISQRFTSRPRTTSTDSLRRLQSYGNRPSTASAATTIPGFPMKSFKSVGDTSCEIRRNLSTALAGGRASSNSRNLENEFASDWDPSDGDDTASVATGFSRPVTRNTKSHAAPGLPRANQSLRRKKPGAPNSGIPKT